MRWRMALVLGVVIGVELTLTTNPILPWLTARLRRWIDPATSTI